MRKTSIFLYSDNKIESHWFKSLHPSFENFEAKTIKGRGKNPNVIENLIQYDRPDIIIADNSKGFLVIEKTQEVPTGHNVGQRLARLVNAVKHGVPSIYFCPFDAKKHGIYSSVCHMNIRLLKMFDIMWDIYNCPIVALNWISDKDSELINDGTENNEIKSVLNDFVKSELNPKCQRFLKLKEQVIQEYKKRLDKRAAYKLPPKSVQEHETIVLLKSLKFQIKAKIKICLLKNKNSIVYVIKMNEEKCKRQDPYTGTQFLYYYLYCDPGKINKKNLILHFPNIRKNIWQKKNPNNLQTKSSNWYLIANAFIFSDEIQFIK